MTRRALATGLFCLALLVGALGGVPAGAAPPTPAAGPSTIQVFPTPGTPTLSPGSQLSFRGAQPRDLADLRVVGSRSGDHPR